MPFLEKIAAMPSIYPLLLAGLALPNHAIAAQFDVYGKLELQALYTSADLFRYADAGWQLGVPLNRLGGKITQPLNDGWSLLVVYEWQFNGFDNANRAHRFTSRNIYTGIQHNDFGSLTFGKNDSRFKRAEGTFDQFNESLADIAQLVSGQDRLENIVTYQSPRWQQWQFATSYQTGASDEIAGGYDASLSFGDAKLHKSDVFIALAYQHALNQLSAQRLVLQHALADSHVGRLSAGLFWQYSDWQQGNVTQNTAPTCQATQCKSGHAFGVSLLLSQEQWQYKLQWVSDHSRTRHTAAGAHWSVGVDYQHSSKLTSYFFVSQLQLNSEPAANDSAAVLGIRLDF